MTAPALVRRAGVDALPPAWVLAATCSLAAAGLAISSRGSVVAAAVLVGLGLRHRWAGVAVLAAVAAASVRFGTTGFDDLAGIQSVLGPAGIVGPPVAAASAWLGAAGVVLAAAAARRMADDVDVVSWVRVLPAALASGALAAVLVAGPGPGGGLELRIAATVVASLLAGAAARWGHRLRGLGPLLAVVAGLAALVTAAWPS